MKKSTKNEWIFVSIVIMNFSFKLVEIRFWKNHQINCSFFSNHPKSDVSGVSNTQISNFPQKKTSKASKIMLDFFVDSKTRINAIKLKPNPKLIYMTIFPHI